MMRNIDGAGTIGEKGARAARRTPPRGVILAAACMAAGLTGATYAWSVFSGPLAAAHGWSSSEVSSAYSLYYVFMCAAGFFAGWLQRRVDARWVVLVGGLLFSAAWALLGRVGSLPGLYVGFSLCAGVGCGLVYNVAVSAATRWFPDRRGFANGLCIGAVGLAPLVFAPLGGFSVAALPLPDALLLVAAVPFALTLASFWFVRSAPAELEGASGEDASGSDGSASSRAESAADPGARDVSSAAMVKTPLFWAMFACFFFSAVSGAMVIGHAAGVGIQLVGLIPAQASIQVALLALGNFLGRFGFGAVSDRIGRCRTLAVALALTFADAAFIVPAAGSFAALACALVLLGACYGAVLTVMPSLCGDAFGARFFGQNYALLFIGFTAAGFVGPMVGAAIYDATGSYAGMFAAACLFSAVGLLLAFAVSRLSKRYFLHASQ